MKNSRNKKSPPVERREIGSFAPSAEEVFSHKPETETPAEVSEAVGGPNAVLAALKARGRSCRSLLAAEGRRGSKVVDEIFALARALSLPIKISPRLALDRAYGSGGHQGIVAVFDKVNYGTEDSLLNLPPEGPVLLLALDKVEDPGNLGALIRSACAFGASAVLAAKDRTAPLTPAALRAAAGAAETVPLVRVVNLRRSLESLKDQGFWLVGADGDGSSDLAGFDFPERTVLVMGSEGKGLSAVIKKVCDFMLAIPQRREAVSSLNVSVAGAILMCQYYRRHGR